MGCCKSKARVAVYRVGMRAETYYNLRVWTPMKVMFNSLFLTNEQGFKAFQTFMAVDADRSGVVSISEFCKFFDIDKTRYVERLFGVLDYDKSGELDFKEFLAGLWNICTMTHDMVATYGFNLYDFDRNGYLSAPELDSLVRMLYGKESTSRHVKGVLKKAAIKGNHRITLDVWIELTARYSALMRPAFDLQTKLRNKVLGGKFWRKATIYRLQNFKPEESMYDVIAGAQKRETAVMAALMQEAFKKAADLEARLNDELDAQEQKELEEYEANMTVAEGLEARKIVEFRQAERQARAELLRCKEEGKASPPEVVLAQEDLVRVIRKLEQFLMELPQLALNAIVEQERRTMGKLMDGAMEETKEHYSSNPREFRRAVKQKMKDYSDVLKMEDGGVEAAKEIITPKAMEMAGGTGRRKADMKDAAEMQVRMDYQKELVEERSVHLQLKFETLRDKKAKQFEKLQLELLQTYAEVDDSMVDYTNIWRRRFDPVEVRYVFFAPRTDVTLYAPPKKGQENPDYEHMERFRKYGITL